MPTGQPSLLTWLPEFDTGSRLQKRLLLIPEYQQRPGFPVPAGRLQSELTRLAPHLRVSSGCQPDSLLLGCQHE